MMTELLNQIIEKSIALGEPKWLTEKRKLAFLLHENFKNNQESDQIIKYWLDQKNVDNDVVDLKDESTKDYYKMDLALAVQKFPELLQENLMEKAISWNGSQLNAIHMAFMTGGKFIYVPENTIVNEPIKLEIDPSKNEHLLVLIGKNSKVNLIEQVPKKIAQVNYVATELLVGFGAQVNYYQANEIAGSFNHQELRVYQAKDSSLKVYASLLEQVSCRSEFSVELDGQGSSAEINMVALASNNQSQSVYTSIKNCARNTNGLITQHGVAKDHAKLSFDAVGEIVKDAKQSTSNQTSRLLTLSDECKGEANPALLIKENDVKAGHAASIGKVDADQLYYLESRGLSREQSEFLLTNGFLSPVLEQFPDENLRQKILEILAARLKEEQKDV